MNKLQNQLAEAEAAEAARKKEVEAEATEEEPFLEVAAPNQGGQGGVLNEWVCYYLHISFNRECFLQCLK